MTQVKSLPKEVKNEKKQTEVVNQKTSDVVETAAETKPTEEQAKKEIVSFLEKYKPEPVYSAESRIEKVKQFEALGLRYNALKQKKNELEMFKAGNDKIGAKIVFKNSQGYEFTVQNSNVIQKLVEAGAAELEILLSEANNEVLTFEI